MDQLSELCKTALHKAHGVLESLKATGTREVHDEQVVDISTRGDRAVSEALAEFFQGARIPAVLYSEESGRRELMPHPRYTITFDDIDGTDNYHRGRGMLPYCTVVTIFDSPEPNFEDAVVAGILEHNSKRMWLAERGKGCLFGGSRASTSGRKNLDRRTLVTLDHYASAETVSRFLRLYPEAWVKDFGTSALHMAGVSSGLFDAYIAPSQKAHELGAGYLLIKEAGGFLVGWDGNPLDKARYDFDGKYPIIAASTRELGSILRSKI